MTVGSINPYGIWIRSLLDSGQAFPNLQLLLIYSINSGVKGSIQAAVVSTVTLCQAECLLLFSFFFSFFFFPL